MNLNIASVYTKQFGHIIGLVSLDVHEKYQIDFPLKIVQCENNKFELNTLIPWCDILKINLDKSAITFITTAIIPGLADMYTRVYNRFYEIPPNVTLH